MWIKLRNPQVVSIQVKLFKLTLSQAKIEPYKISRGRPVELFFSQVEFRIRYYYLKLQVIFESQKMFLFNSSLNLALTKM